jgi:ribosome-associated protein
MIENAPKADASQQDRPQRDLDSANESKRIEEARKLAVAAAKHAANTRCTNVAVLELGGLSPVTDFFVIATGTSARQMRTVADELAELAEQNRYPARSSSGYEGESWILLDCVDVIIHIFNTEARGYYDLDSLWGDAKRVDWQPPSEHPAPPAPA